jgi:peptidoglycan/LPS O-acetylase OafA/YrhL
MPENRAFFPALDGMRAIAFMMVFLQHYCGLKWGWSGVDLFFVLSGFLITGILFDSRNDLHRARNFYVRRTLRIFPLYYGIMLLLLLSSPVFHWDWSWGYLVWPAYLGNFARFIHPYSPGSALQKVADFQPMGTLGRFRGAPCLGHFWSLCIEEQFYLFWPWVVFAIRDRKILTWICALTLPICLAMRLIAYHTLPGWELDGEILYRATPFRLDALLLGGLLALWMRGPLAKALLRTAQITFPIAIVSLFAWAVVSPVGHIFAHHYKMPGWEFTWGLSAIDLLAALLILVAIRPGSLVYRVLSIRPLRWIGRISYGAYVLHDIPHLLYLQIGKTLSPAHAVGIAAIIAFIATIGLAWLSFHFIESPILGLKERWTIRGSALASLNEQRIAK